MSERTTADIVDYLRRAAVAVYVAMDKVAADSLSPRLREAADRLAELDTSVSDLRRLLHGQELAFDADTTRAVNCVTELEAEIAMLRGQCEATP